MNALKQAAIGQILAHREYTAWSGSEPTAHEDRWYHYDMLGNVTALTNANGQVAAQFDMEAFGTVRSGAQEGVHLTTKEWDTDSGLYYFNARWYDKEAGRWLQQEPTRTDGPNLYHFAFNVPTKWVDFDGLAVRNPSAPWYNPWRDSDDDGVPDKLDNHPYNPMLPADAPRAKVLKRFQHEIPEKQSLGECVKRRLDPFFPDDNRASTGLAIVCMIPPVSVGYGIGVAAGAESCIKACLFGGYEF